MEGIADIGSVGVGAGAGVQGTGGTGTEIEIMIGGIGIGIEIAVEMAVEVGKETREMVVEEDMVVLGGAGVLRLGKAVKNAELKLNSGTERGRRNSEAS